jgi:glycosyltransferase involved in cell wall biosynthesis
VTRVVVVDLLCNSPFYCGALASALREAGADAELASPRFYLEPDVMDSYPRSRWILDLVVHASHPRIVRLAMRSMEIALNSLGLLVRIGMRKYDVVHVQWVPLAERTTIFMRVLRAACRRSGTLLVVTAHNAMPHDRPGADAAVVRRNLDCADLVVAQTDHVAKELVDDVGVSAAIATIPHGPMFVDQPLPSRDEAAARLGRTAAPTVLLFGLIRPYKGVDILADAWPDVLASVPGAKLLVVGKLLDPTVRPALERLRAQPGVDVVDHYVSMAQMLDYYAVCDVVVFPYRRISQSGGLMTAAGLGRPTVITPIDGLREQVRTLTSAIVADDVSAPAVARALAESLSRSSEQLAAAAHDRTVIAESSIGWAAVARSTLAAYAGRGDVR